MWQELLNNKEWVFSGLGTAILLAAATYLISLARFVSITGVKPLWPRRIYEKATVAAITLANDRLCLCYSRLEDSVNGTLHSRRFNHRLTTAATDRCVSVVVLLAKKPDRLHCAFELSKAHIKVYFSSDYRLFDLRYVLVDNLMAVVGEPTKKAAMNATLSRPNGAA